MRNRSSSSHRAKKWLSTQPITSIRLWPILPTAAILLNRRNVPDEEAKVRAFAEKAHLSIVGDIPRSDDINRYEDLGQTVIEGDPDLPISHIFLDLAQKLLQDKE